MTSPSSNSHKPLFESLFEPEADCARLFLLIRRPSRPTTTVRFYQTEFFRAFVLLSSRRTTGGIHFVSPWHLFLSEASHSGKSQLGPWCKVLRCVSRPSLQWLIFVEMIIATENRTKSVLRGATKAEFEDRLCHRKSRYNCLSLG